MNHRPRGTALAVALLLVASLRAFEVTEWKNRQPVKIETIGLVSVALPDETLDAARQDLGDLRVLDPAGREVAFLVHRGTRSTGQPLRVKTFRSILMPMETQLTFETDDAAITDVILETPALEFVKSANIETSADGRTWQTIETGTPVFRQRGAEQLQLRVNARFVRVTLDDRRSRPVPFTGAKVIPGVAIEGLVQPVPAKVARREEFAGETVLTVELPAAHLPLESVVIASPERLFTRRVNVGVRELRSESAVESTVATGTIYALAADDQTRSANATVALDFTAPSRELSVHIVNEDSPPLPIDGVRVSRFEVRLYFEAAVPGDYTLLSGHPQITPPRYDVSGMRIGRNTRVAAIVPGALAANPGYRAPEALAGTTLLGGSLDPAPWSYRKTVQLAAAGVQQLELDLDVLVHARRDFGDVRLMRDGVQVPYLVERPELLRSFDLAITAMPDPRKPHVSRWSIKLPRASVPLTRLTLNSPTAVFQRHLRLFETLTDDRGDRYEHTLASGDWSHTPDERRVLVLALNAAPMTHTLVLETEDGDNPAISLGSVVAAYPVTRLLFKTDAPPTLYYGNREAVAPRYDLALVAGQILTAEKNLAALGPEEETKPGGARHALSGARGGIVFWSALAVVVAALLGIVAKLLPKAAGQRAENR